MADYKKVDAAQLDAGLTAVADAIRAKTGNTELLSFPDGMSAELDAVYGAGKKAEYDAFWDAYQINGTRRNYYQAFMNTFWTDANFNPKYPIICEGSNTEATNMFYNAANLTRIQVPIIVNGCAINTSFTRCSSLETIVCLSMTGVTSCTNAFTGCTNLKNLTIDGTIEINGFDVHWSSMLTKDSILSIINALSADTSGLTVTLSLAAVNNAFETSEGAADGSASEEWLALAATKSNWTISLA